MKTIALSFGLLAFAFNQSSHAAACHVPGSSPAVPKWQVPLSIDELFKTHPAGSPDSWPIVQQHTLYTRMYQDSADDACQMWAAQNSPTSIWTSAQRSIWKTKKISASLYKCAFDCNGDSHGLSTGNGVVNDDDFSQCPALIYAATNLQTEEMCDRVIDTSEAPYASLAGSGYVRGAAFDPTDKAAILHKNMPYGIINQQTGTIITPYHSDAYDLYNSLGDRVDPYEFLEGGVGDPDQPQVDHLIPRTDKFGCGCGTNSPKNALVISAKRNNSMQYFSDDVNRIAILDQFAPLSSARTTGGDDEHASVDKPDDLPANEIGGCAAGGSNVGGFGIAGIALAIAARRRR